MFENCAEVSVAWIKNDGLQGTSNEALRMRFVRDVFV